MKETPSGYEGLPAIILKNESRKADKGRSFSLEVGLGADSSVKMSLLQSVTKTLGLGRILWINYVS
jgi:hypothetical protein